MKQAILAAAIALSCGVAAAAPAAASPWYVGAGVGHAEQKFEADGYSDTLSKTAFNLNGGYKVNQNIAIELGYANFGKTSGGDSNVSASVEPSSVYVAAVGSYPLNPQFAVYGKLGAASNRTKLSARIGTDSFSDTQTETTLVAGIGASYTVAPNVDLTLEYMNFGKVLKGDGVSVKASQITIGARFSF